MCFNEISPYVFNFIKNNFKNKIYCSYEKQDISNITNITNINTNINNEDIHKLNISNIKLGRYSYTLQFNSVC
jgi:GTP1/Obg family GTP-binding protein